MEMHKKTLSKYYSFVRKSECRIANIIKDFGIYQSFDVFIRGHYFLRVI